MSELAMKRCPGYPIGACLTWIEASVDLCRFCRGTQRLQYDARSSWPRRVVDARARKLIPYPKHREPHKEP